MSVVIIGYPASGKTKIGTRIAERLGLAFIDTDAEIVRDHGPIPQIFAEHGEPYFRGLEREAVAHALRGGALVSLGGGAVLDERTQADLEEHTVILLTIEPGDVEHRINNAKRPLITGIDSWIAQVESRKELYFRLADVVFDTSYRPRDEVASEIVAWLQGRKDE